MKLNEIYLVPSDANKLADLLEEYNKGKKPEDQITFQEMATRLLADAICREWYGRQAKNNNS